MIRGGGVVLLYCLLAPGPGYFQVDSVITVRVFRLGCGQIIRVGGSHHCPVRVNNTDLPPHTVNLTSQQSSKQHQAKSILVNAHKDTGLGRGEYIDL